MLPATVGPVSAQWFSPRGPQHYAARGDNDADEPLPSVRSSRDTPPEACMGSAVLMYGCRAEDGCNESSVESTAAPPSASGGMQIASFGGCSALTSPVGRGEFAELAGQMDSLLSEMASMRRRVVALEEQAGVRRNAKARGGAAASLLLPGPGTGPGGPRPELATSHPAREEEAWLDQSPQRQREAAVCQLRHNLGHARVGSANLLGRREGSKEDQCRASPFEPLSSCQERRHRQVSSPVCSPKGMPTRWEPHLLAGKGEEGHEAVATMSGGGGGVRGGASSPTLGSPDTKGLLLHREGVLKSGGCGGAAPARCPGQTRAAPPPQALSPSALGFGAASIIRQSSSPSLRPVPSHATQRSGNSPGRGALTPLSARGGVGNPPVAAAGAQPRCWQPTAGPFSFDRIASAGGGGGGMASLRAYSGSPRESLSRQHGQQTQPWPVSARSLEGQTTRL